MFYSIHEIQDENRRSSNFGVQVFTHTQKKKTANQNSVSNK